MEHQMIAVLVQAENQTERQDAAHDTHYQRRLDALRERDRRAAARVRANRWRGVRASIARGIRRLAEAIEPSRPTLVSRASDPCLTAPH